jgi:effector-binding domain-containing protein
MKPLKIIGIVLLVLVLIVGVGGMLLPSQCKVSREIQINAPGYIVFTEVNTLRNWNHWSPWHNLDPNAKNVYSGPAEGVGSTHDWDSENPDVGKGSMKIVSSEPYSSVGIELNFMEQGVANSSFQFDESEGGYKVVWNFESDMGMNPIARWIGVLMMDKWLGKDFESGLSKLKEYSESRPKLTVESRSREAMDYIGIKATVSEAEFGQVIGTLYGRLMEFVGKNNLQVTGAPFAQVFSYSPEKIEMEACIPVSKAAKSEGDIVAGRMEAGTNAEADYYGKYEETGAAHYAIDYYLHSQNKQPAGAPYEVYVTDPGSEPDTAKWLTKVCYPLD